jgi:3-oxoacyl-[acyl-carrier-protein] synthase-1
LEESEDTTPEPDQLELFASAQKLRNYFSNPNDPVMISNACISGLAAVIVAKRILENGNYDHAVVVGADTMSRFVFSGFESFQALSQGRCKPFSADRDGINLGEAAASLVLSTSVPEDYTDIPVRVLGGSMSNDANHISGPSRTGEELSMAIQKALGESELNASDIDFISAHGTATVFNDEMEAKAVRLAGLQDVPLNSMKAYFGHTLGAAGLVESVISIESLRKNMIVASAGFSSTPMENSVNVCTENISKELINCIKIASGFGGCNAAIIYSKN